MAVSAGRYKWTVRNVVSGVATVQLCRADSSRIALIVSVTGGAAHVIGPAPFNVAAASGLIIPGGIAPVQFHYSTLGDVVMAEWLVNGTAPGQMTIVEVFDLGE